MTMYGSTTDKRKIDNAIKALNHAYSKIPSTKGCLKHIALPQSEGGCNAWCCRTQFPSVLYVEFIQSWRYVTSKWDDSKILNLIKASLRNYLFPEPNRGCVFFDKDKNLCSQHEVRPFNCRIYGITPEEEFKPRYERLKVINPQARDQCGLVSTEDGSKVTTKDTDFWWNLVKMSEKAIGIKEDLITDEPHGSYRAYHDHILIHLFGEDHLEKLSDIRTHCSDEAKEQVLEAMISALENFKFE